MRAVLVLLLLIGMPVVAHEQTPAYPTFEPSYVDGIYKTNIQLFNRRNDVNYYQIEVFDEQWQQVPFAAESRLIELQYLGKKSVEVYVRKQDVADVKYVCTRSKLTKEEATAAIIASRICSKIK